MGRCRYLCRARFWRLQGVGPLALGRLGGSGPAAFRLPLLTAGAIAPVFGGPGFGIGRVSWLPHRVKSMTAGGIAILGRMADAASLKPVLELEYSAAPAAPRLKLWVRIAGVLCAVPAALAAWPAFASTTSPAQTVHEIGASLLQGSSVSAGDLAIFLLGLSFFTGTTLLLWKARLLAADRPRAWECWLICACGIAGALCTVAALAIDATGSSDLFFPPNLWDSGKDFFPDAACIAPAAGVLVWMAWKRRSPVVIVSAILSTAFIFNGVTCLRRFSDDADVGWTVTLVACIVLFAEMLLQVAAAWEPTRDSRAAISYSAAV
jgi:hypothetical protein